MRLDVALVKHKKVSSRSRARRAITTGQVSVDGKVITKPSRQVGYNNDIEVTGIIDIPEGYLKLSNIQKRTGFLHDGDFVLDLGSSAGGFLLFASEIAYNIRGIEYSCEFIPQLQEIAASHENITVVKGDVFTMPLSTISDIPVDVIMNDLTVEPGDSITVLEKVLPLLKPNGRILQVLKLPDTSLPDDLIDKIQVLGLTIRHLIKPTKGEVYVIAVQRKSSEAVE